ncbi:histidinol-phosphatase HisJ [Rossellomorea vietnamensis]|uniref:Histidinol-phosphatase HisJ n=1 Tax=Rossellomorea vietnamensis TaxID=218284 RepID=A0ACD4C5G5_9BACI|nr:histidinol-phosphatase HisJ [Rossellomorea vietnamensis]UXH43865.1 histidinol-phosphatase HisJ [Rossellomorea vietnamensis]
MVKVDGHVHTPFCPHGSTDSFEMYVERAIALDYRAITFTEHAPLPEGFVDTTPDQDSGMDPSRLSEYFDALDILKEKYKDKIIILSGLEVDYIDGFEKETAEILTTYGPRMDDSILSVHFLQHRGKWDCLDFSPDVFGSMVDDYGSVDAVYARYYETVLKSTRADLGVYKPKRIGHITLVKKFQKLFPASQSFSDEVSLILQEMAGRDLELDYNGAGFVKPHCGESYPPPEVIKQARAMGIKIVYGSDAHTADGLDQGRALMK